MKHRHLNNTSHLEYELAYVSLTNSERH